MPFHRAELRTAFRLRAKTTTNALIPAAAATAIGNSTPVEGCSGIGAVEAWLSVETLDSPDDGSVTVRDAAWTLIPEKTALVV